MNQLEEGGGGGGTMFSASCWLLSGRSQKTWGKNGIDDNNTRDNAVGNQQISKRQYNRCSSRQTPHFSFVFISASGDRTAATRSRLHYGNSPEKVDPRGKFIEVGGGEDPDPGDYKKG